MQLFFQDTLQVADATGQYTLQALINNVWTNINTITGPEFGTVEVDSVIHSIPVDTQVLNVGQTYKFRWLDSSGTQSNITQVTLPMDIGISLIVVNEATVSITLDGSGVIDWGDNSLRESYNTSLPQVWSHHYQPGSYAIIIFGVKGLKNFAMPGTNDFYLTVIDQFPDTLVHVNWHNNKMGNYGLPNGPTPLGLLTADLSGNVFDSNFVCLLIQQFVESFPAATYLNVQGQIPPAPPSSGCAPFLATLIARGVTVIHD